jgi:alkyl hydroperoxide reductase subunit AhpC
MERERAKVTKEELQEKDTRFLAVYVEAQNSVMIMLSEREDKLGTLAIAVPKPKDLMGSVTSSVLLGDKNVITARMFAEFVAAKKGKIAMVSVYLEKVGEMQAQAFFMHLIEKIIKGESQKEPTTI